MKKFFPFLLLSFILLFFHFCGKKGPLQAPLVRVPQKVESFKAFQRGEKIIVEWTNPTAYIDGSPLLSISEIEIWLAEEDLSISGEPKTISGKEFEEKARLLALIKKREFPDYMRKKDKSSFIFHFPYKFKGKDSSSKTLIFGLRIKDEKKRESDFSNLLSITPQILPSPPNHIQASLFEEMIEISWEGSPESEGQASVAQVLGYNVYRSEAQEEARLLNSSLLKEKKYEDKDFAFGKTYRYFIRASVTESPPFLESDDSEAREVEAKDIFAPSPPSGLTAISGPGFITLSWNENREKDLAGYRVWRKEEGQVEYVQLTPQLISENTYTDSRVEKRKTYYYAITACDRNGNESKKSEAASEIAKDEFR